MSLLNEYRSHLYNALSAEEKKMEKPNRISSELVDRRVAAEKLAYHKAYESTFNEPVPEGDFAEDAFIFRIHDDTYGEDGEPRGNKISPTLNELIDLREEAARAFGRTVLHHEEFAAWLAYDISECHLTGQNIETMLGKYMPQIKDALDAEYLVNLIDAALAKPPQVDPGLIGFFLPDAPPPFRRPQLKRAREWALEQYRRLESASANDDFTDDKDLQAPVQKVASKPPAKLTLRQIALIHFYEPDLSINKSNGNAIATNYGHTSGAKLYDWYCKFQRRGGRTDVVDKTVNPMIKAIETILPHLSPSARQHAERELKTLIAGK